MFFQMKSIFLHLGVEKVQRNPQYLASPKMQLLDIARTSSALSSLNRIFLKDN